MRLKSITFSHKNEHEVTDLHNEVNTMDKQNEDLQQISSANFNFLQLALPISRLSFETVLNEVSVSVITLYNKGNVTIFFEWVPEKIPNRFKVL